ncbi:hypothetical protein V9T40_011339 [Parthenolecanium corni]|uniref:MPN domain-containing protein n=1 Tax=Parthenolecanium corni TaxID=536013 RepID=A0AAN9T597_9HEMI
MEEKGNVDLRSLTAEERLKRLSDFSNSFQVDSSTPAKRYYNTGEQMIRRADVHLKDHQLEEAFVLYLKYMILILEKIRKHPDHKNVPAEQVSTAHKNMKSIADKAEKIKSTLREIFQAEHNEFIQEKKREKEILEKRRKEEEERQTRLNEAKNFKVELSEGILKNTVSKEVVKPVPYLPDDFLVYEIPETKSSTSPVSISSTSAKPGIDRSTKPSYYSQNSNNAAQYTSTLRMIVVPSLMLDTFLNLAQKNTSNNIETCGILAGKMKQNRLIITHLIIPQQYGTPDSCATTNEEDLFSYQTEHDLITLGWIHTHPSQTAFLSSVDLHTHYSYQIMMSEAIAIVCAPRYSQTGFFQLTPDYGLDFIANCQQKGFHPHPSEPPLFQDAEHCEVDEKASVELVDLRR